MFKINTVIIALLFSVLSVSCSTVSKRELVNSETKTAQETERPFFLGHFERR